MPQQRMKQPKTKTRKQAGITLKSFKGTTTLFGPRFRGAKAGSALASATRFQRAFPKTKITFPTEFRVV